MSAEAAASAGLAREGHLVRLWRPPVAPGERKGPRPVPHRRRSTARRPARGAATERLDTDQRHSARAAPNDPPQGSGTGLLRLPDPRLTLVYRLDATIGETPDLGDFQPGHRRLVQLTGGTFTGPELSGTLVPGASADLQTVLPDAARSATSAARCGQTKEPCYVESRGVRHAPAEVLARLGHDPNRDRRPSTRLADQGRLHQRRRPPGRQRDLRNLPGPMNAAHEPPTVAVIIDLSPMSADILTFRNPHLVADRGPHRESARNAEACKIRPAKSADEDPPYGLVTHRPRGHPLPESATRTTDRKPLHTVTGAS